MEKAMCRICLVENIRMHSIINTDLQYIYEKLTDYEFVTEARPLWACYMCYKLLQHCHELMIKCLQSEAILQLMMKGNQDQSLIDKRLYSVNKLCMTQVLLITSNDTATVASSVNTHIKVEIPCIENSILKMKQELIDNEDKEQSSPETEYEMPQPIQTVKNLYSEIEVKEELSDNEVLNDLGDEENDESSTNENDISSKEQEQTQSDSDDNTPLISMKSVKRSKRKRAQKSKSSSKKRSQQKKTGMKSSSEVCNGGRTYICDYCQKCHNWKSDLRRHILIHTGEMPHKCNICQSSFRETRQLNIHVRNHTDKPHQCEICQTRFKDKSMLDNHMRKHHSDEPLKCNICSKIFASDSAYYRHSLIHRPNKKLHKCELCSYTTMFLQSLRTHFRIHTGERPYSCEICQKSFRGPSGLVTHIRIHTGDKPYVCSICQKGFVDKGKLNRHFRIHTGDKPHKCEICSKSFIEKGALKIHLRVHTGEKPYVCVICSRAFPQINQLKDHMRRHAAGKIT